MKTKNYDIIGNPMFLRLLALESGFTVADTRIFFNAFKRIIEMILVSGKILNLYGFIKIYVKNIPGSALDKPAWDQLHKKRYNRKPSIRISYVVSPAFKEKIKKYAEDGEIDFSKFEIKEKE